MDRAYSLLKIRRVDDDAREIHGMATTPKTDRMGDVIDSMGAKFQLPMPLLWQHQSDKPVGLVEFATPTKKGIPFVARLPQVDEPGVLRDRIDEAWQSMKAGLIRAVSIGFRPLESERLPDKSGRRFKSWEWLELSLVTIPANSEATINLIRSFDTGAPEPAAPAIDPAPPEQAPAPTPPTTTPTKATTGRKRGRVVRLSAPGVTGRQPRVIVGSKHK